MSLRDLLEAEVARVWATQTDGAHDVWHLRRVWAQCQSIADAVDQRTDRDVLLAGSYLHDIVNLPKNHPQRARSAALSAEHAVAFLAPLGWSEPRLNMVAHAIESHSFSAGVTCTTIEAEVLQDADRLEALGAIGIARCFNVSGQLGGALFDGGDPRAADRALDDRAYALDHFEVKLYKIAETLNTAPARAIAAQRVAFMRGFANQLVSELGDPSQM